MERDDVKKKKDETRKTEDNTNKNEGFDSKTLHDLYRAYYEANQVTFCI